jgi:hypothetical protein
VLNEKNDMPTKIWIIVIQLYSFHLRFIIKGSIGKLGDPDLVCVRPVHLALSGTSQQYFSLRTNQPPAISQQYFSLRTNQHQTSATS